MRLERLTIKAQEVLAEAQHVAERFHHQQVDEIHIGLALLGQPDGMIPALLKKRFFKDYSGCISSFPQKKRMATR